MMRTGCLQSNILAILSGDTHIQNMIPRIVQAYQHHREEDVRGTRTANIIDPSNYAAIGRAETLHIDSHLSRALGQLLNDQHDTDLYTRPHSYLIPRTVQKMKKVSLRGVRYSDKDTLPRDSRVLFRINAHGDTLLHAGEIKGIFSYACPLPNGVEVDEKIYLIIERCPTVPEITLPTAIYHKCLALDKVYRRYGAAGGFLCSSRMRGGEFLVEQSHILSHFAMTPLMVEGLDLMHVLPLDQASVLMATPLSPLTTFIMHRMNVTVSRSVGGIVSLFRVPSLRRICSGRTFDVPMNQNLSTSIYILSLLSVTIDVHVQCPSHVDVAVLISC